MFFNIFSIIHLNLLRVRKLIQLNVVFGVTYFITAYIIAYPLFLIYNKSISVAAIPADWKLAEVIAILKKERNQNEETADQLV